MRNKNLLLIGSMVVVTAISATMIAPAFESVNAVYQPRVTEEKGKTNADGAMQDWRERRVNPATGQFDEAWLKSTFDAAREFTSKQERASTLVWNEEGPDNVGGRTRAICIDRNDANHVFAGSVSGGLFESFNGGNNWALAGNFNDSIYSGYTSDHLRISSMCQTLDGTFYLGTGCNFDNWSGTSGSQGIYSSTDGGTTWNFIANSTNFTAVNELQADPVNPSKIWIAGSNTSGGAMTYTPTGGFAVASGLTGSSYFDVKLSPDGTIVLFGKNNGGSTQTFVSTDSGNNFSNVSGTTGNLIPTTGSRKEYAISYDKNANNMWTIYASASAGDLRGVWISEDNGQNWYEIAPSNQIQSQFQPFTSQNGQGFYDHILSAVPGTANQVLLGGIDIYKWYRGNTTPVYGQWSQKTLWFASEFSSIYAHADQHEMEWDQNGILYIGNDGGVGKSFDHGEDIWIPHNKGYNVTQFYSVSYNKYGHSMGGTQDNGTNYKNYSLGTMTYDEVNGGDGFDCDLSHIFPETQFATVYNGDFRRSDDEGNTFSFFGPVTSSSFFNTIGRLYENGNDTESQDSVMYIAGNNYNAGDTITYLSRTQQKELEYILTAPLADGDTITLQDPIQSIFAAHSGTGKVYITRHALRFNVTPTWKEVLTSGSVNCIEFSSDGHYMYVGSNGTLYVVKGLETFYSPVNSTAGVTVTAITGVGNVEGIGVDPNDADHIILVGSSTVKETFSATIATGPGSFTDISGNLPSMPTYDGIIDWKNNNIMVIGTEYGAYSTNDGGITWTYQAEMGFVPVYAVRQQWRNDSWNGGVVYLGTFGRGIWSTSSLVGVNEPDATAVASNSKVTEIKTYPNPMTDNGTIAFTLKERNNVDIFVMDLSGRIIMTQNLGQLNQGENKTTINVEGFAAGTYVVLIKAGDETGTDKLVVTH